LLIPSEDPEYLTGAIHQLLGDSLRSKQMGAAARRWVAERFPHTRVHALTVALYKQILLDPLEQEERALIRGAAAAAD
jgi:hypothetical protein